MNNFGMIVIIDTIMILLIFYLFIIYLWYLWYKKIFFFQIKNQQKYFKTIEKNTYEYINWFENGHEK